MFAQGDKLEHAHMHLAGKLSLSFENFYLVTLRSPLSTTYAH